MVSYVSCVYVALLATCVSMTVALTAESHPLDSFVRAITGRNTGPIDDLDIVRTFAVEAPSELLPKLKKLFRPTVQDWYQSQKNTFPVLSSQPEQLHIAVTGVQGEVSIMWLTDNRTFGSQVCFFPQSSPTAISCSAGHVWTYDPISIIPWYGNVHYALMKNLQPAETYCYRVGAQGGSVSEAVCFVAPDLHKDTITVALGGDMGTVQLFGHLVAAQMRNDERELNIKYDAFWLLGDLSYSTLDPGPNCANGEFFWDTLLRQEESFTNHVPWLVTYGNHDFDAGDSGAFINRFRNPHVEGGVGNFYWAYTHGPVKFVSMCTEVVLVPSICNYSAGSPQYEWLEQQFSSTDRSVTPWLILGGHRPMYSSDENTDSGNLQRDIEPLLRKYNVDLQLAGHMHVTEVVYPVYNDVPFMSGVTQRSSTSWTFHNPAAPVHLTTGILGAFQYGKFPKTEKPWSAFHQGQTLDFAYGYVRMVANRTSLHFTCIKESTNATMWDLLIQKDA